MCAWGGGSTRATVMASVCVVHHVTTRSLQSITERGGGAESGGAIEGGRDGCTRTTTQKRSGRFVLFYAADDDECLTAFSPHE